MQQNEITNEIMEQQLDQLAAEPPVDKRRVWEVDFLRGALILFVVWDHFMWDVMYSCGGGYKTWLFQTLYQFGNSYYGGALRAVAQPTFVSLFVFLSGVSCSFSRNNGKRAVKMILFALLLTAATYAFSAVLNVNMTIRFNVIHVIALSVLLWSGIDWIRHRCNKNWQKNLFGLTCFAVIVAVLTIGYCFRKSPSTSDNSLFFFLVMHSGVEFSHFTGGDYLSFFPDFGWFLVGAFLGLFLYKDKTSLFPSVNEKYVAPFTLCGRKSLWIYFISQIVMYGFIYLFHGILNVL